MLLSPETKPPQVALAGAHAKLELRIPLVCHLCATRAARSLLCLQLQVQCLARCLELGLGPVGSGVDAVSNGDRFLGSITF